jgi:hypothetical protein
MTGANAYDTYEWDPAMGPWNSYYAILRDVNNLETLAIQARHDNYQGIAMVLRVFLFSVLTDSYGDIPFSEVGKAKSEGILQLKYDPQKDIYEKLISDLAVANSKLGSRNGVIDGDILYQGQFLKWKKFANSLRIRLLMRTEKRDASIGAKITQMINNPAEFPLFESNVDNAALRYLPDFPNQWPMFPQRPADLRERKLSETLEKRLKSLRDPRLAVLAAPTPASVAAGAPDYVGVPNGLTQGLGARFNGGSAFQSEVGRDFYYEPNRVPGILMHYSELMFLLAEASQKRIIVGSAPDYYNKGVQAAFSLYNVPIGSYLQQPGIGYEPANGLGQIATQKWISLFYVGLEAWFDWRRTGLPAVVPGPANVNNNRVPVRMQYPILEQSLNNKYYTEALARQGADDINTSMWLLK